MAAAADGEEDKVFVAVPPKPWAGRSALSWTLGHLYGGRNTTIVVTHVLVPAQMIPIMGGKFHASKLSPEQVSSFRMKERQKADKMLDDYIHHCLEIKVKCEKLILEKDDAATGLVELIELHGINKLVISAAADKNYSKIMNRPTSITATAVMQRANPSCNIWFVCKERLIYTRDGVKTAPAVTSPTLPNPDHGETLDLSTQQEKEDDDVVEVELELGFDEQLKEACRAVENLIRRALGESLRRQKAEEKAVLSLQKVKDYEEMYVEEARRRRELEGALARANREIWELRRQAIQQNGAMEEYHEATTAATKTILKHSGGFGAAGGIATGGRALYGRTFSFVDDTIVAPYNLDDDDGGFAPGADEARWWLDAADGMSSSSSTTSSRRAHPARLPSPDSNAPLAASQVPPRRRRPTCTYQL